jgi:hypothetical protein
MGGFFDRLTPFEGVHDPIYTRALVCKNDRTEIALITADLVNVTWNLVEAVRKNIERETGIPRDNILIAASHNHSGPSGYQGASLLGVELDRNLFDFLVEEMTQAVVEAKAALRPALVGFRSGDLSGTTRNRQQNNNEVVDPEVGVLKLWEPETRATIAVLFNFTGHPVILGGENMLLSGEYPGEAQRTVEAVLGGVALFTQGACGDVTVHRSGPPFLEVARLGRALGGEVIKSAELIQEGEETTLVSLFEQVEVEGRQIASPEEANRILEEMKSRYVEAKANAAAERILKRLERQTDSAETAAMLAKFAEAHPENWRNVNRASVHILEIGSVTLAGFPGELFVEYALELKQRSRHDFNRPLLVVGFANGYNGYLVTPRAMETGGYEQAIRFVEPSAGRKLVERAVRMVEECSE